MTRSRRRDELISEKREPVPLPSLASTRPAQRSLARQSPAESRCLQPGSSHHDSSFRAQSLYPRTSSEAPRAAHLVLYLPTEIALPTSANAKASASDFCSVSLRSHALPASDSLDESCDRQRRGMAQNKLQPSCCSTP